MDTSEILKKVRKIEIKTRGLSNHIFSGEYHSAFKGRGMSFSEVRDYQYGDDVRNIDWNVTARTGDTHIKVFEEERELTLMLLVDISKSSFFGTRSQFKNELITELCAVLAFSALSNNDKVGALLFSDQKELFISPSKGKKHILRIIRELIDAQPTHNGTDITQAIEYITNVQKKRSIVFLISDFMDDGYETALRIMSKRHDVVAININDLRDYDLPQLGLMKLQDLETGKSSWVNTSSKSWRNKYKNWYDQKMDYFDNAINKSRARKLNLELGEDYVKALMKFFKQRKA